MTDPGAQSITDECYRCGYELRGIASDQPCPECGLLAERSRRVTDELHNTRPKWLRTISLGINLLLVGLVIACIWPILMEAYSYELYRTLGPVTPRVTDSLLHLVGWDVAALIATFGLFLLTRPERYEPADHADKGLRWLLRLFALIPLVLLVIQHVVEELAWRGSYWWLRSYWWQQGEDWFLVAAFVLCAPLPLLLFLHLRGLAQRARSAHLAEHCLIVGTGASASLLVTPLLLLLLTYGDDYLGTHWTGRSNIALGLMTLVLTAIFLFLFWSFYLLIRFAFAFWRAARQLRQQWKRADRALPAQ